MRFTIWRAGVTLAGLVLFGCGLRGPDPLAFNNSLSGINAKLKTAGLHFGESVGAALTDQPGGQAKMKQEFANVKTVMRDVKTEAAALKVPNDETSKNLYSLHQEFLKLEEKMINEDFQKIEDLSQNASLNQQGKAQQVMGIINRISVIENKSLGQVQQAQRTFAEAHHIQLTGTPN